MKLYVAILACCLFVWSASAEPLPSECRWGASYWCRSQSAAKRCGRVDYCQTNVWRKATSSKVSSSVGCEACSVVTALLRSIMSSAKTEAEAKTLVEKACSVMSGEVRTECSNIVDDYFDMIWKLIETEMDNEAICKQIGVCSSTLTSQKHVSATPCDLCHLVTGYLKTFVDNNSSEAEIKAAIEALCNLLPGTLKDECITLDKSYFDLIWTLLKSEVDSGEICKQIGLCNTTSSMRPLLNKLPTKTVARNGDSLCDECKDVMGLIKPTIDSNSTETEVKEFLDKLCSMLPSSVSDTCNTAVNSYFDIIWSIVKEEVDSGQICVVIGLCNSTVTRNKLTTKPAPPLRRVFTIECELCELLIKEITPFITSNTTETELEKLLDNVCDRIPAIKSICTNVVATIVPTLLDYLRRGLDPATVCTAIQLCNNNNVKVATLASTKQLKAPQGFMCNTCKKVTGDIISALMSDSLETKVEDKLTGICGKLPSKVDNSECQSLLKAFFPIVWKFIKSEMDSQSLTQEACSLIHACKAPVATRSVMAPQGPIKCVVCKLIAHELEKLVDMNSTRADIEAALVKVCSIIPDRYRDKCTSFIKGEGDQLIPKILSGGLSAICDAVCLLKTEQTAVAMPKNTVTCDACTEILELLKNYLSSNEGEVESLIMDVCDLMPSTVKPECTDFVKMYGPDVIKIVVNYIDPKTMCQQFCTARRFKLISLRAGRNRL